MFSTNVCTLISSSLSYIYKFEYNFFRDHTKYSKKTFYTHINMNACFYNLYRQPPQSKLHFHIFPFSIPMNILFAEEKGKRKTAGGENKPFSYSINRSIAQRHFQKQKKIYIYTMEYLCIADIHISTSTSTSRPHYWFIYF